MSHVVVDTDVVSLSYKESPKAALYYRHLVARQKTVSFMTLAELDQWALRRKWGAARVADLGRYLQGFAVYYADRDLCRIWAEVTTHAFRKGKPIETADAWIAASALALGVPLVTNQGGRIAACPSFGSFLRQGTDSRLSRHNAVRKMVAVSEPFRNTALTWVCQ